MTEHPDVSDSSVRTRPMTVREWLFTLLVLALPLINVVMYFVWAFSGKGNINRRNFCRASVVFFAVGVVLSLGAFLFLIWSSLPAKPDTVPPTAACEEGEVPELVTGTLGSTEDSKKPGHGMLRRTPQPSVPHLDLDDLKAAGNGKKTGQ